MALTQVPTRTNTLRRIFFALTLAVAAQAQASLPPDSNFAGSDVLCASADASTQINISFTSTDDGLRAQVMRVAKGALGSGLRQVAQFVAANGSLNNSDSFVVGYTDGNEAVDFASVKSLMVDIGRPGADGRRPAQVIVTDRSGAESTSVFTCL